jgi:hypothetical protein
MEKTEPHAPLPLARCVVKLAVFLEDRLKLSFRDADPGIPHLYDDASFAGLCLKGARRIIGHSPLTLGPKKPKAA